MRRREGLLALEAILDTVATASAQQLERYLNGDPIKARPLGPIGRRAGVIWIRRNFGKERVVDGRWTRTVKLCLPEQSSLKTCPRHSR